MNPDSENLRKIKRDIVAIRTSCKWIAIPATSIFSLSAQARGALTEGIFNRKVRQEVAKIAKS